MEHMTTTAQKAYDKAFCQYLEEGLHPQEAAEKADLFLLEWSKPLPLPDPLNEDWL